jgi:L-threonylcarbamoyladenylate synthase
MQIFNVNPENPEEEIIEKAAQVLSIGGIIVYPTETLYGLGASIINQQAVQRIFEIKGRNIAKPISMAFRNVDHAKQFAQFNPTAEKLAEKFLPGPLTIILLSKIPFDPIFGGEKIAIRIIDNKVTQQVLYKVKVPITATSANISGKKNPTTAQDVIEQIGERVDLILDAGKCKHEKPSTVVDCSSGEVKILREGVIDKEKIENI